MTKSEITSTTPSTSTTATTTTTNVSTSSATATTTPTASATTNATISTNSASTGVKTLPRDSSIIVSILKDMGIVEYEPRVVHQLLEFTYRYVTTVLEDAQVFSQYANKKVINADDVKLAIQLQVEKMFTSPPPRDSLMEIARQKNNQPLPPIKSHAGPRLPPDRYSLIACNYRLKSSAKLKEQQQLQLQQQQSLASSSSGIGSLGSKITLPFRTLQSGTAATILTQLGNRSSSNVILPVRTPTAVSSMNTINNNASNSLSLPTVTEIKSVNQLEKEIGETGMKRKLDDDEDA